MTNDVRRRLPWWSMPNEGVCETDERGTTICKKGGSLDAVLIEDEEER